ncbi:ABC transporter substrate-binding protein [Ideonella sp. DXS22W]|uniref:ABC transporter substrate-binding protein n=1 Tax=Pseudaquabacterium inlustre TaxID=2984192 RepID=A0ABU9CML5_9BURK
MSRRALSPSQRVRRRMLAALGLMTGGATIAAAAARAATGVPGAAGAASEAGGAASAPAGAAQKVLRLALRSSETSLDPARIVDLYSRSVTNHIFEALYGYDHLARPPRIRPLAAEGMPEHNAEFTVFTVRLKPGQFYAPDPAFKGRKRPLRAADFVFAFKRFVDPENKSPLFGSVLDIGFVGLAGLRDEALKTKKPFDYDKPIEGLQAPDDHTLRFVLDKPSPRFLQDLCNCDLFGGVAREVVEFYGDKIGEHPVGTGPYRVVQWRRSSFIALERNPNYRERYYDAEPAADDAEGQAMLARFKGRRLPMIDRVELSVIEEGQPRWLSFLNTQVDALATSANEMPIDFVNVAMPGGKLAPNLAKRGIQGIRSLNADCGLSFFNMEDPVVGGYTPEKVALRRAIGLGIDVEREIRLARRGQAIPAQSQVLPHTSGYDAAFKSENGDYDPARARALLDTYGYLDRNGDGWRELPDGRPLELEVATQPEQINRQFDELWKKNINALGIRVRFKTAKWPEQLKAARAGKLQLWMLGSSADRLDGQSSLARLYGPQSGGQNLARFKHARFDEIFDRMKVLPDGPEREALFLEAKKIGVAFMPYKVHVHRFSTDLLHPWVVGYRRPVYNWEWWHLVDIDESKRPKA